VPRYFFHILNEGLDPVDDDEGAEFEDYEAAKHEAVESIRDLAADAIKGGRKANGLAIEITDDAGKVLEKISARELFNA
jgi:hypothetical protein